MCLKVIDFLTDDDFIHYALGVTLQCIPKWEAYFKEHPEEIADAEEAKAILVAPADIACPISADECQSLKNRIVSNLSF